MCGAAQDSCDDAGRWIDGAHRRRRTRDTRAVRLGRLSDLSANLYGAEGLPAPPFEIAIQP
jgi:hypothetical protein